MNFLNREKKRKKDFQKELNEILPLYNKELSFLNEKYGVLLDAYLQFNEKGIVPSVRILLKKSLPAPPPPPPTEVVEKPKEEIEK